MEASVLMNSIVKLVQVLDEFKPYFNESRNFLHKIWEAEYAVPESKVP